MVFLSWRNMKLFVLIIISLVVTGKSLSEALIFASTNPQYDDRLFIELQVQYVYENSKFKPGENMLCTEIVSDIQKNFCTQHVLPMFCKWRASDKDLPVQLKKMQLNKEKGLKRLEVMLEDMENVLVELKKMVDNCLTHTKLCDNPPPSVTLGKNFFLLSLFQIQIWQDILQNFGAQECLDSNLDW